MEGMVAGRIGWVRFGRINLDRDDEIWEGVTSKRVGKVWEKSGVGRLDLGCVCRKEEQGLV